MTPWKTLLSLSMLSLAVLSCGRGKEEPVLIPEDGDGTEETLAMSFDIHNSSFTADVKMEGGSFQTGPEGTRCYSEDLTPTSLQWDFRFFDNTGTLISIAVEPVELTGKVGESATFDSDVSLMVSKNDTQKQYAAHVRGSLQYLKSSKEIKEYGHYKGEVLVTWEQDGEANQFHIVKFCPRTWYAD
ncbi:MAG: hypothetical protein II874_05020 [Bacteroidales bacterium]|nr:hypothetical protein [Bacteroidales bacterium]